MLNIVPSDAFVIFLIVVLSAVLSFIAVYGRISVKTVDGDLEDEETEQERSERLESELEARDSLISGMEATLKLWTPVVDAASRMSPDEPETVETLMDAIRDAGPERLKDSVLRSRLGR